MHVTHYPLNVRLLKLIIPLRFAWFWLGVWLPYYLLFTSYAGVGIIEAIVISLSFFLEIPSGAIADIMGRKRAIIVGLLLAVVGNVLMGLAGNVHHLYIAVIILAASGALLSGTWEALLYDSLSDDDQKNLFEHILTTIERNNLVIMAIASIIGGVLYVVHPSLPFILTGAAALIAAILALFLTEPHYEKVSFNVSNYIFQSKQGFKQLFQHEVHHRWLFKLFLIFGFATVLTEVLDPALALEHGFDEKQLGMLYAIAPLVTAFGVYVYGKKKALFQRETWGTIIFASLIATTVFSPMYGLALGGLAILYRNVFYSVINVISTSTINQIVVSQYRATTLSTFTMIRQLPYVLFAVIIGKAMDVYSPSQVGMWLSILFIAAWLVVTFVFPKRNSVDSSIIA